MTRASVARMLQCVVVAQAIAIVALGIAWWSRPPTAPPGALDTGTVAPAEAEGTVAEAPAVAAGLGAPAASAAAAASHSPEPAAMVYGTVRTSDGKPVNGTLSLRRDDDLVDARALRGASTFAFAGLARGSYQMTARFDDQLPLARDLEVAAARMRLDIVLEPSWRLLVHVVTADGTPLAAALGNELPGVRSDLAAIALDEPLGVDRLHASPANRDVGLGRFRGPEPRSTHVLPDTAIGSLLLPADRPLQVALLLGSAVVAQQAVVALQPDVTFTVRVEDLVGRTAMVRFRVVDDRGVPVADATVNLDGNLSPRSKSGTDGRMVLDRLLPGRVRLHIVAGDRIGPPLEIDVHAGSLDLGDVALRRMAQCELDFSGFGSGGVELRLLDGPSRAGWRMHERFVNAQMGAQAVIRLFPGRYGVYAHGEAGVDVRTIDIGPDSGQRLRFDLAGGARLRFRAAAPLQLPLHVEIFGSNGTPVFCGAVSGRLDYSLPLPVDTYEVRIAHADGRRTQRTVKLTAGGAVVTLP